MLTPETIVTEVPKAPAEVDLLGAAGLIPRIAGDLSIRALNDRLRIDDPVVRAWALARLASMSLHLPQGALSVAMQVARQSAYLRRRLVPSLLRSFRFDLVDAVIAMERDLAPREAEVGGRLMRAQLDNDHALAVSLLEQMYLATGDPQHLLEAREVARGHLGWRSAVAPSLRCLFVGAEPLVAGAMTFLSLLAKEGRRQEFSLVGRLLEPMEPARTYVRAQSLLWNDRHADSLTILESSGVLDAPGEKPAPFLSLAATAAAGRGDHEGAARFHRRRNELRKSPQFRLEDYLAELDERAGLRIAPLPEDEHANHLVMTGFPRSGTTLLENALAAHPRIDTCEETSSLAGSAHAAYRVPTREDPGCTDLAARALRHRDLYYRNLARHARKPGASVVIDKTPILAANIKYLEKLFPRKRYLFSIRHPYDVVLSNFKQDFSRNIAMAAFNDIGDACVLYDYVMRNWFEVFPGETSRVRYVRYDALVTDFERVIRDVLAFIGVEWTDEVMRFAEHSGTRPVRTPSYANVRQGLTIGVQSSWRNYGFLFDSRCRALLDPWVERFGYANP